eukprot:CAMPEP_0168561128 /NCGR_PEP_ID=MMETSP0413-20121227/11425_1 /TAXON_ID=136452 /ORGANISM="Filamoeba nolandi, Strain NC-AS-23-1" /LENGTH=100 /DNA_ID=CAMNT_0008592469 /DNA_START=156 /DNA_END=458 /DNA_ORIENTATION=+
MTTEFINMLNKPKNCDWDLLAKAKPQDIDWQNVDKENVDWNEVKKYAPPSFTSPLPFINFDPMEILEPNDGLKHDGWTCSKVEGICLPLDILLEDVNSSS